MSVVPVGGMVALGGTTYAARPELGGVVVRDALLPLDVHDSAGNPIFKGTLQDRVVKENVSGTLDFYQTLRADPSMPTPAILDFVRRISFAGTTTDVDYRTDGLGQPSLHPAVAKRPSAAEVDFEYGNGLISAGQQTLFYFVKTNATSFDVNGKTELGLAGPPGAITPALLVTAEPIAPQRTVPGGIVGSVFLDANNNGKRDPGEAGLAGWTVYLDLTHADGTVSETSTLSNADGVYAFTDLAPGSYEVREASRPGFARSTPLADSTAVTVNAGENSAGPAFGDVRVASVASNFDLLVTLARNYGKPGTVASGDLNGDYKIDFADLVLLARSYGGHLPG